MAPGPNVRCLARSQGQLWLLAGPGAVDSGAAETGETEFRLQENTAAM